jgi:hypothetical protein
VEQEETDQINHLQMIKRLEFSVSNSEEKHHQHLSNRCTLGVSPLVAEIYFGFIREGNFSQVFLSVERHISS